MEQRDQEGSELYAFGRLEGFGDGGDDLFSPHFAILADLAQEVAEERGIPSGRAVIEQLVETSIGKAVELAHNVIVMGLHHLEELVG